MFKSVFSRYITAFMLIILISFIMVSAVISAQVSEFNSNNQRDLLDRTANSVKYYIESEYVRVGAQDIGSFVSGEQNRLMREISTLAALSSDAFVFVVDRQGSFIIHSDNTMSLTSASRVPWDIMNSLQKKNGKVPWAACSATITCTAPVPCKSKAKPWVPYSHAVPCLH